MLWIILPDLSGAQKAWFRWIMALIQTGGYWAIFNERRIGAFEADMTRRNFGIGYGLLIAYGISVLSASFGLTFMTDRAIADFVPSLESWRLGIDVVSGLANFSVMMSHYSLYKNRIIELTKSSASTK